MASTDPQPYAGPDRDPFDRTRPPPPQALGRARVRPECARFHPDLARGEWYPVVDRNPNIFLASETAFPLPGYVYLDTPAKGSLVRAAHFEVEH